MDERAYALHVEAWQQRPDWDGEAALIWHFGNFSPGMKVLDVGTNTGKMLDFFTNCGCRAYGTEINEQARKLAKLTAPHRQILPTIEAVCAVQGSGTFDAVVMSHVLGHVEDPVAMLDDAQWSLKSGGTLIIAGPNPAYDRLMIPYNILTGYRSDPTLRHSISRHWISDHLPYGFGALQVVYMGELVKWIPPRLCKPRHRSRLLAKAVNFGTRARNRTCSRQST